MSYKINCQNCGGPIQIDENYVFRFCPYCGASINIDKKALKFAQERYRLEHEEAVRRQKVIEKQKENLNDFKQAMVVIGILILLAIGAIIMSFVTKG